MATRRTVKDASRSADSARRAGEQPGYLSRMVRNGPAVVGRLHADEWFATGQITMPGLISANLACPRTSWRKPC